MFGSMGSHTCCIPLQYLKKFKLFYLSYIKLQHCEIHFVTHSSFLKSWGPSAPNFWSITESLNHSATSVPVMKSPNEKICLVWSATICKNTSGRVAPSSHVLTKLFDKCSNNLLITIYLLMDSIHKINLLSLYFGCW